MTLNYSYIIVPALALAIIGGGAVAGYANMALADSATGDATQGLHEGKRMGARGHGKHGVTGEVTAVSGSTVTVTGKDGTFYTVTTDGATVSRVVEGALSDIQVGDRIGVHGEVSGTNVTATRIMDDIPEPPARPTE